MKSAERKALVLTLVLFPFFVQACNGLASQPTLDWTPMPTPAAWATPGGLQTAIAEGNIQATERALEEENEKDKNATPRPGMVERDNVSVCLKNKEPEACFTPSPVSELSTYVIDWLDFITTNKGNGQISENASTVISDGLATLSRELSGFIKGEPNSIEFTYNNSLFPESDGGTTIVGPTRKTFLRTVPPKVEFFLPQGSLSDPGKVSHDGTRVHEFLHGAWRIDSFRSSGFFDIQDATQEELNAEFYGDVATIFLAKTLGVEQNPQFKEQVNKDIEFSGKYFPFIAWFLDQKGIVPENPLWRILYNTSFYYSTQSSYLKFGNPSSLKALEEYRKNWNAYPWTEQEKAMMLEMFQQGVEQGYMTEWAYPDFP